MADKSPLSKQERRVLAMIDLDLKWNEFRRERALATGSEMVKSYQEPAGLPDAYEGQLSEEEKRR